MQLVFPDATKVFFTSDTHFGHANVLKYCNRPWGNVEAMNDGLINNWNSKVGPTDTIFHLGDFAFGGSTLWHSLLGRLNGRIHLIVGNHDIKNLREGYMRLFESVYLEQIIKVEGKTIILNHCPLLCYSGDHENVYQLYGHVHSGPKSTSRDVPKLSVLSKNQYDVGVDNNDYYPVSFAEILAKIGK